LLGALGIDTPYVIASVSLIGVSGFLTLGAQFDPNPSSFLILRILVLSLAFPLEALGIDAPYLIASVSLIGVSGFLTLGAQFHPIPLFSSVTCSCF